MHRGLLEGVCVLALLMVGCVDSAGRDRAEDAAVESCMLCHNGSKVADYAGPGLENPHPFGDAANLTCTACHGGNGRGTDKDSSHVPPPPEIGDRNQLDNDARAYFNRLTLAGMDKFADYTVNGKTYSALDYLQFIKPGDLRVVGDGRSCGKCHTAHADAVPKSPIASSAGIFGGAMYAIGIDNAVPGNAGLYEDTAGDLGVRAVTDTSFTPSGVGEVRELIALPVFSVRGAQGPTAIHNNPAYDAANLADDVDPATGQAITGSELANLYHEQVAFTCGDCHLGSAGANNRYGDFRSAGCAACHMRASLSGRSTSSDPNINREEPRDPDAINDPELPHLRRHLIQSVAKTLSSGEVVMGIDDYACAGCHQGSNRMVMQYWGIRLDQNQDLRRGVQYPANPVSYRNTNGDQRLFDPQVRNDTFNGRNRNQYILEEDYDGDGRDDTPADVHYEAGLGCIDCHGSADLHGDRNDPSIKSRMEQGVAIQCESCHGNVDAYAATKPGTGYDGQTYDLAMDSKGNVLRHVVRETDGSYWLTSRLDGRRHFIPQTRDVVVDSGKVDPDTQAPLYSVKASYAMGRNDGLSGTGLGPQQAAGPTGFRHGDTMDCASCHASWTNTCMGCHLVGEYDTGNNFSNITGERIVYREKNADFVYQSPVYFALGVNTRGKITQTSSNTKVFYQWEDRRNDLSKVFAFSDRNGGGNDPGAFGALGHNALMAHSIRGKVSSGKEGPRYCVACHLTQDGLDAYGTLYAKFRDDMANDRFDQLDFAALRTHFGKNPGNQLNSPLWVHMVAGLGTGLFLFDENGCPINPLDSDDNRKGCNGVSPADAFDPITFPARVVYNLDRIVDENGVPIASSNHMYLEPGSGAVLRQGAPDPQLTGPLGADYIRRLTDPATGIVLDSYYDADGQPHGNAPGGG